VGRAVLSLSGVLSYLGHYIIYNGHQISQDKKDESYLTFRGRRDEPYLFLSFIRESAENKESCVIPLQVFAY
jgi:hypothetical protein